MKIPNFGAHISVANGYAAAYDHARTIGCTAMQIFAKSPMQSKLRAVTDAEARAARATNGYKQIKSMVIHAGYMLNFSKAQPLDSYQCKSLIEDVENSDKLGGLGPVVHCGKQLALAPETARENFIANIVAILDATGRFSSAIILENTAGQGSEIGYRFDDFGKIFHAIKKRAKQKKRIKVCIDTAHSFGAGYDLRDKKGAHAAVADLDREIGLESIAVVHFNDSKKPLFSRVDRHQDIGYGTIGEIGLGEFMFELSRRTDSCVPFILETPEEHASYAEQIKKMRSWFGSRN